MESQQYNINNLNHNLLDLYKQAGKTLIRWLRGSLGKRSQRQRKVHQ